MTLEFRPMIEPGTQLTKNGLSHLLYPSPGGTVRAESLETGRQEIWTLQEYLTKSTHPGASQSAGHAHATATLARLRRGKLMHRDQLSPQHRDELDFRKALVFGVEALAAQGQPVRASNLNVLETRRKILDVARQHYTTRPIGIALRGGSIRLVATMPKGRRLLVYWDRFVQSGYDEMALVDQTWMRGNRTSRISFRVRELIDQAIDDVALDLKQPNAAAVHRRHESLITLENVKRAANGLEDLRPVSRKTVSDHIQAIGATALAIARSGERATVNARTRGRTDEHALSVGELVEIDENKISLITITRRVGMWQRLSDEEKTALQKLDAFVKTRLWLVVALDVATRMPLGWVLADAPNAEATLEVLRMATRSKERERIIYGCESDPMPAVGIACVRNDNGVGLRNGAVKTALLGMAAQIVDVRAYHSGDKPYVERFFGSMETRLFNLIHGYTGNRAGALEGYDAIKSAAYIRAELYAIITKYLIDEYPLERNYGTTFMGQRPLDVAERLAKDGWGTPPVSPQNRRLHLGWRFEATITDEGIKVLGLPYNSPALQRHRDSAYRKVAVFIDPDSTNEVTVVVQGFPGLIMADLSWTGARDMTFPEFLAHVQALRAEDPLDTKDIDLRLARIRSERFDMLRKDAIERDIPRSYMTRNEAQAKANRLMAGMHAHRPEPMAGTLAPGMIGNLGEMSEAWDIGAGFSPPIDGQISEPEDLPQPAPFGRPNTTGKLT